MNNELHEFLLDNLSMKVYIDRQGHVCYDSGFEREFKALGGDMELLLNLVGDHIYDDAEYGEETTDYVLVIKEYFEQAK